MARIIGLCGRSGSGKSMICRMFLQYGIPSIDTDAVYRKLTAASPIVSPCVLELAEAFGGSVMASDGSLDREQLAAIVFAPDGKDALRRLNEITHKYILNETVILLGRMLAMGAPAVILDAPALFESRLAGLCDTLVCVTADDETSIRRIVKRDGIDEVRARARLASQIPAEELCARCDFVVDNSDGASPELTVKQLAARFTSFADKGMV